MVALVREVLVESHRLRASTWDGCFLWLWRLECRIVGWLGPCQVQPIVPFSLCVQVALCV